MITDQSLSPPPLPMQCGEVAAAQIATLVLPLWRTGMSDRKILERIEPRYDWLYRQAPSGSTRTWVVRDPSTARVIGAGSVLPVEYLVGSRTLQGGLLIDFIVSPQARTAGPAVMLQREIARQAAANGFDFLFGYPNQRAWPVMQRAGYRALSGTRTWIRPMSGDMTTLKRQLHARISAVSGHLPQWFIEGSATITAAAAGVAIAALDHTFASVSRLMGYRLSIEAMGNELPEIAEQVMAPISRKPCNGYRAWRFKRHPTHQFNVALLRQRGVVKAWAVLHQIENRIELHDAAWSAANRWPQQLLWLLLPGALAAASIKQMRVSIIGSCCTDKLFKRALYWRRDEGRKVVLHVSPELDPGIAQQMWQPDQWRVFAGELDI